MNARSYQNLNVLKQFKSGRFDPAALKGFTGWGGLREDIYRPDFYRQMKRVLTDAEIAGLKHTLSNAYYTPDNLIRLMYRGVKRLGCDPKRILEPAAGTGAFLAPLDRNADREIVAVETEALSVKMLKALYPEVEAVHAPFERVADKLGKFDLIIGNPPYGRQTIADSGNPELDGMKPHHYFLARCVKMLNPGGLLAMVLPSYCLDNLKGHARDVVARSGGKLLAAYRLPDDLFSDAKVTVDIAFFGKRAEQDTGSWRHSRRVSVGGHRLPLNRYFEDNPDRILGELSVVDMYRRKGLACRRTGDPLAMLAERLRALPSAEESTPAARRLEEIKNEIAALKREAQALLNGSRSGFVI